MINRTIKRYWPMPVDDLNRPPIHRHAGYASATGEAFRRLAKLLVSASLCACMATLCCTANAATAHPEPGNYEELPGMYVYADSRRVHIHCSGEGSPTVLLEAGLGSTSLDWIHVQPIVALETRVCSYDRGGYGWSGRAAQGRFVSVLAQELDRLLLMAGEKPPYVLAGHSFGGLIAQYYAAAFPHKVSGLVLIDSTHQNQFEVFDAQGIVTPQAPSGGMFFIRNFDNVPAAMPDYLKPLARFLAARPKSVESLYSELRNLRHNASATRGADTLILDSGTTIPLQVVSRAPIAIDPDTPEKNKKEQIWHQLQSDLAARYNGTLTVANTSDHYVHLGDPQTVANAILHVSGIRH